VENNQLLEERVPARAMSKTEEVIQRPDLEQACRYLLVMNFLFSSTNMAWLPRLSEVKQALGLTNQVFGSLLGLGSVGGLVAYISAGYLLERFGSPVVIITSVTSLLISFSTIIWSPNTFILALLVLLAAFSGSVLYIGLSGLQIVIQHELGRPIIAKMHAASTVGFLLVVVLAGVISPFLSVRIHITVWTLLIAPFFLYYARQLPSSREFEMGGTSHLGFKFIKELLPRTRMEFVISYALLFSAMVEISINDWLAIYAHESLGIPLGPHVIYFILFCIALILARWRFPYLLAKYGPVKLIQWGAVTGGMGFALGVFLGAQIAGQWRVLGFVIAGIGIFFGGFGLGGMQAMFLKILGDTSGISLNIALARVYVVFTVNVFLLRLVISAVVQHFSVAAGLMVPAVMLLLTFLFAHLADEEEPAPFFVG
jgi:MFS family permease